MTKEMIENNINIDNKRAIDLFKRAKQRSDGGLDGSDKKLAKQARKTHKTLLKNNYFKKTENV